MTEPAVTTTTPAPVPPTAARWIAGVLLIMYGFAKVNGAQFLVTDAELSRPMGEVSGFWLTWYYFGWSTTYKFFIAGAEIVGGLLLLWPRTSLAGALLLLPVTLNIVVIDLLYGVLFGAQVVAWIILICVVLVISPHLPRLREAVLGAPASAPRLGRAPRAGLITMIVLFAIAFNWWGRNRNIRSPTPIDGTWNVTSDLGAETDRPHWRQVFFELNRAHQANFRAPGRPDAEHHFEVDSLGTIRVWETWLRKGDQIMEGRVDSGGVMDLTLTSAAGGGHLRLERSRPPQ